MLATWIAATALLAQPADTAPDEAMAQYQACIDEESRHLITLSYMGYSLPSPRDSACLGYMRTVMENLFRDGVSRDDAVNTVTNIASDAMARERALEDGGNGPRRAFVEALDAGYRGTEACFADAMAENPVPVDEDWGAVFAAYVAECQEPAEQNRENALYMLGDRGGSMVTAMTICASANVALAHGAAVPDRVQSTCVGFGDQFRPPPEATGSAVDGVAEE